MTRARSIQCPCCGLQQTVLAGPGPSPRVCTQCAGHRDLNPDAAVRTQFEHVRMHRQALDDAQDAANLAHAERDFYRDQLRDRHADTRLLVETLQRLDQHHHYRGDVCSCGAPQCSVVDVLAAPAIAGLIGTYDEQRHVLRELRAANPDDHAGAWTDIDVTLVYPKRKRPRPYRSDQPTEPLHGRHRAAG